MSIEIHTRQLLTRTRLLSSPSTCSIFSSTHACIAKGEKASLAPPKSKCSHHPARARDFKPVSVSPLCPRLSCKSKCSTVCSRAPSCACGGRGRAWLTHSHRGSEESGKLLFHPPSCRTHHFAPPLIIFRCFGCAAHLVHFKSYDPEVFHLILMTYLQVMVLN